MILRMFGARTIAALALLATHALAGTNSWTPIPAPAGETLTTLAVDPVNSAVLYVGTINQSAGTGTFVYKTVDAGAHWTKLPLDLQRMSPLIVIDPANPATLYVSFYLSNGSLTTTGANLYKSTDGGATWTTVNLGLLKDLLTLAIDPVNPAILYAVTGDGVFRSTNGGGLWLLASPLIFQKIIVDPAVPNRLYASHGGGVSVSIDSGANWTLQLAAPPTRCFTQGCFSPLVDVEVDPVHPSRVFALINDFFVGTDQAYRSDDGGSTWQALTPLNRAFATADLAVTPDGSMLAVSDDCGSATLAKSLDLGFTWTSIGAGLPCGGRPQWVTSPSAPAKLYALSGGIYEYTNDPALLTPTCYLTASPTTVAAGGSSTLSVYCSPAVGSYIWSSNTGFNSIATGGTVKPTQTTTYTVQGVNGNGASNLASATVLAPSPRLANISTRAFVQTGADVVIGGFIIGGSTPKKVMMRATGPSLTPFGVANALQDPTLQLIRINAQVAVNDDWQSAANAAEMIATGLQPNHPKESAILMTLDPNVNYYAIVSGVGGTTGTGLVEVFEVDHPEVPLINISTRAKVLTANDRVIAGFIVEGNSPKTVVINVAGPSLTAYFPAAELLANPTLTLVRSSDQAVLATNDDWILSPDAAAIQQSGFAPNNQKEPAIMATLPPGAYTAIVEGVNRGTGKAVVGVFAKP
jgi:hypothetical protein